MEKVNVFAKKVFEICEPLKQNYFAFGTAIHES